MMLRVGRPFDKGKEVTVYQKPITAGIAGNYCSVIRLL